MSLTAVLIQQASVDFRRQGRDFGLAAERIAQAIDQIAHVPGALDLLATLQGSGDLADREAAGATVPLLMAASTAARTRDMRQIEVRDAISVSIMAGTVVERDEVLMVDDWSRFLKGLADEIVGMPDGAKRDTAARTLVETAHNCAPEAVVGAIETFMRGRLSAPMLMVVKSNPEIRKVVWTIMQDALSSGHGPL